MRNTSRFVSNSRNVSSAVGLKPIKSARCIAPVHAARLDAWRRRLSLKRRPGAMQLHERLEPVGDVREKLRVLARQLASLLQLVIRDHNAVAEQRIERLRMPPLCSASYQKSSAASGRPCARASWAPEARQRRLRGRPRPGRGARRSRPDSGPTTRRPDQRTCLYPMPHSDPYFADTPGRASDESKRQDQGRSRPGAHGTGFALPSKFEPGSVSRSRRL